MMFGNVGNVSRWFMRWSPWSKRYLTVRSLYAIVG
jgi:hypothetical protein